MRVLLIGCEYAGTTTLAKAMFRWGEEEMGADFGLFHDHWKIPSVAGHWPVDMDSFLNEQEQAELLAVTPKIKEQMQRHSFYYHIQPGAFKKSKEEEQGFYPDYLAVGMHLEDSVYGPLYFSYGADGRPGARSIVKRTVENALMEYAPDFVLVLLRASSEVIRRRMREDPHHNAVLKWDDVDLVLERFEEEYQGSAIARKLALDTSTSTVEETMAEFAAGIEPFLTEDDRERRRLHQLARQGR